MEKCWPGYAQALAPYIDEAEWIPERLKRDPQLRTELDVYMARLDAMGYFSNLYQDPDYPDFWPCYSTAFNIGFNNPDDCYLMAMIDEAGTYRITGNRGTVRIAEMELGSSSFSAYGVGQQAATLSTFSLDEDATLMADGAFEVVLSRSRPDDYFGDWWEAQPGALFVLVRQRSYNWVDEVDGRFAIERLDVPAARPRRGRDDNERRLANLAISSRNWVYEMTQWFEGLRERGLINAVEVLDLAGCGIRTQLYAHGTFELAEGEALLFEATVPESCKYWMVHLADELLCSIDQVNRQTSINGHQARVDQDGCFRAVVCASDPGVPNWLDTAGYERGLISARWWSPDAVPDVSIKTVLVDEVPDLMPGDTPKVTPSERDAALRKRRRAAQLRRRW